MTRSQRLLYGMTTQVALTKPKLKHVTMCGDREREAMMDLQTLLKAIDELPIEELEELKQHIIERAQQLPKVPSEDAEARITALEAGFAELREGLSAEELEELVAAMNYEYIEPEDPTLFGGTDDLPEDKR